MISVIGKGQNDLPSMFKLSVNLQRIIEMQYGKID
jgi:hypothetical protein